MNLLMNYGKSSDIINSASLEPNQLSKDKPHMSKTVRVKKLIEMTGAKDRTIWRALEVNPETHE